MIIIIIIISQAEGEAPQISTTYQVYEGEELPAASVCLVRGHVYCFVVADDGEVGQEDRDSQDLGRDERHLPHRCLSVLLQ